MLGDCAPLVEIVDLKKKHGAMLLVDEAHSLGVYGDTGSGVAEAQGVQDRVRVLFGTFSKALSMVGGFVAADQDLVDYLRHGRPPRLAAALRGHPVQDLGVARIEPGHGDSMDDAGAVISGYIEHRLAREQEILGAIATGSKTVADIVDVVSVQNIYNVSTRGHDDVLAACESAGAAFIPWFPIAGGDPIRITSDTVPAHGASWLPGGDALVVSSTRSGQANLWRVPLDGTEPTALTSGVGDDTRPVVSLDGKWVVYAHQDTTWQLVSSDPNTGEHDVLLVHLDLLHRIADAVGAGGTG